MDDDDWDTLNRIRKEIHEKDGNLDLFVEIPKRITEDQLKEIENEISKRSSSEPHAEEYTEETVPKRAIFSASSSEQEHHIETQVTRNISKTV